MIASRIKRSRTSRSVGHTVFRLPNAGPQCQEKREAMAAGGGVSSTAWGESPAPTENRERAYEISQGLSGTVSCHSSNLPHNLNIPLLIISTLLSYY